MRKFIMTVVVIAGLVGLGNSLLTACGSKFLVGSKGVRHQFLLASIKPTRILIYWEQDETTREENRWNPAATEAMEEAGHEVKVAFGAEGFMKAASEGEFEVVMTTLVEARELRAEVESVAPNAVFLPVLYFGSRKELSQAKKEFGNALRYPTTVKTLLTAVEKSRKASVSKAS